MLSRSHRKSPDRDRTPESSRPGDPGFRIPGIPESALSAGGRGPRSCPSPPHRPPSGIGRGRPYLQGAVRRVPRSRDRAEECSVRSEARYRDDRCATSLIRGGRSDHRRRSAARRISPRASRRSREKIPHEPACREGRDRRGGRRSDLPRPGTSPSDLSAARPPDREPENRTGSGRRRRSAASVAGG